jgi:hypothetical protein
MIHLLEDNSVAEESLEDSMEKQQAETMIRAGREFSVTYSDEFIASLREHQAVSDIWFN